MDWVDWFSHDTATRFDNQMPTLGCVQLWKATVVACCPSVLGPGIPQPPLKTFHSTSPGKLLRNLCPACHRNNHESIIVK